MLGDGAIAYKGIDQSRSAHDSDGATLREVRNVVGSDLVLRTRPGLSVAAEFALPDSSYFHRCLAVLARSVETMNVSLGQRLTSSATGDPQFARHS